MIMSPRNICAGAWLFGLLFGLTLLAHLTKGVDLGAAWSQAASVPAWAWLASAAAWHGATLVQAWRLQRTWRAVQAHPLSRCWSLTVHHGLATRMLPLRLGDISLAWLVHREWGVSLGRATSSLLWMRWQDVTTLTAWALLLLVPLSAMGRLALFAFVLLLGAVLLPQWLAHTMHGRTGWRRWHQAMSDQGPRLDSWMASASSAALRLLAVALLMQQMLPMQAHALWPTSLGIELSAWLPIQGPAGLGTYEAGAWIGSTLTGAASGAVITAAIVAHAFGILLSLTAALAAHLGPVDTAPAVRPAT